jgi:CO/xanthine dehydrogenase Mo-binding subunit
VKAVITYEDVPDILVMHNYLTLPSAMIFDHRILEKEIRYVGECVAAVAATSADIAEDALGLIEVEYEELPAVFDTLDAMQPDAPQVHRTLERGGKKLEVKNNTCASILTHVGNVEEGFKEADLVVENEFRTSRVHNLCLERSSTVCKPHRGGRLEVWTKSQSIHGARMNLASSLGIPASHIKVHRMYIGGGFGAHIGIGFTEPIAALLAIKTGLPVKLENSQEEDFYSQARHPTTQRLKIGVKQDGTITAMDMWCSENTGAYALIGDSILALIGGFYMSMYRCANIRFDGHTIYTNTPPIYCMRGAGNPQQNWAVEQSMDIIAEQLGMDPLQLRLKNQLRTGDIFYGQGVDIVCLVGSCGTETLYKRGAKLIGWNNRESSTPYENQPWIKRGIGMAHGFHTSGAASSPPSKAVVDYTGAIVKMNEDGMANLITASADPGSGSLSTQAAIVAEELGLRYEDVIVSEADTDTTPYDCGTHASRGTYVGGLGAKSAAAKVKKTLFGWAARILNVDANDLVARDRRIYVGSSPSVSVTIREVVVTAHDNNWGTAIAAASIKASACPPTFYALFVEVDVDTMTGEVKVVRAVSGVDCGTPINHHAVQGQLIGGLHMGLGYALTENVALDSKGRIVNPSLVDYKMITPVDMPSTETFFVETYEPSGPYGAKGLGEATTNGVAAAVANAVYTAVGVRIKENPITPEKILRSLNKI